MIDAIVRKNKDNSKYIIKEYDPIRYVNLSIFFFCMMMVIYIDIFMHSCLRRYSFLETLLISCNASNATHFLKRYSFLATRAMLLISCNEIPRIKALYNVINRNEISRWSAIADYFSKASLVHPRTRKKRTRL